MWKNLLNLRSKKPRLWTDRSMQLHYENDEYKVCYRTSREIYNTLSMLPTRNSNNSHKKQDFSKAEFTQLLYPPVFCKLLLNR